MASLSLERRRLPALRLPRSLAHRPALLALAGTGALAALARAPYVGAGVGPDEGGYAYIAQRWSDGAVLYGDLWIDRPQGLMSVYRLIVTFSDHVWAIRVGALLFGVGITLLVGAVGWMLRGPATGIAAAAIYAVVGTGPHTEGFAMNGELAAALPATAAVAAAVAWWRTDRRRWLLAAGALGSIAILMKQGGFDGLVAAGALGFAARGPLLERAKALGLVAVGAAVPISAALIHALTVGFGKYWVDVVAFRAGHELQSDLGDRASALQGSLPKAEADLLWLAAVAVIGLVVVVRRRTERVVLLAWLLAGIVAFNLGGLFWAHYYVQLVPPLAVLAAIGATAFRFRPLAVALTCAALAPVAIYLVHVANTTGSSRDAAIPYGGSYRVDRQVADYVRRNTTPADTVYMLDSRATIYYLSGRRTRYPYLWHHSPLRTDSGLKLMRQMLAAPDRPKVVVAYRSDRNLDKTNRLTTILEREYRLVWQPVKGIRVMLRRGAVPRPPPLSSRGTL